MKTKHLISIRHGDGFLPVEIDALDFSDIEGAGKLCMDGPANFRAMELARRIADNRIKGLSMAVYVIAAADIPVCKVGIAQDPSARLISLQCGNWHELRVKSLLWMDVGAYEVEQFTHQAAREMGINVRGEWIEATPAEACELVLKAARHLGKPACDSATWLENWPLRLQAVAEAKGRAQAIGKLKPVSRKI